MNYKIVDSIEIIIIFKEKVFKEIYKQFFFEFNGESHSIDSLN